MGRYFAYGSNMDVQQMGQRCPVGTLLGIARLEGHRFMINGRGVATIVPDPARAVHGVLWELSEPDELRLDGYEGVSSGTYRKESVNVTTSGENTVPAFVYVAHDSSSGSPRPGYIEKIVTSAKAHGLPEEYVRELRTWLRIGD